VLFPFFCEVEPLMDTYLEWFNKGLQVHTSNFESLSSSPMGHHKALNTTIAAVVFAVEAMVKFVQIHPFGDGNGRISRALMNLALESVGLPPLEMVEAAEPLGRKDYFDVLGRVFQGYLFNYPFFIFYSFF
jgi:hypothetical protein